MLTSTIPEQKTIQMIKKQKQTNYERNGGSRKNNSAKLSLKDVLIVLILTVPKANQGDILNKLRNSRFLAIDESSTFDILHRKGMPSLLKTSFISGLDYRRLLSI